MDDQNSRVSLMGTGFGGKIAQLFFLIAVLNLFLFDQSSSAEEPMAAPFELVKNVIIVKVKVDEKGPFDMMFDTGVDPSVVDLKTARQIGLTLSSVGQAGSGGGTEKKLAYESFFPVVQLGALRARDVKVLAVDLTEVSAALGRPLQGVLGYSLMKNRVVQIDYANRVITFFLDTPISTKPRMNDANFTSLHFRYDDNILIDGVGVNAKKLIANLDTGSNSTFQLTAAAVDDLQIKDQVERAGVSGSTGFNGSTENRKGKISMVTLGGIAVHDPSVTFFAKGTGRDDEGWGLRIGDAFLKDFRVTIDFQKDVITLEKQ